MAILSPHCPQFSNVLHSRVPPRTPPNFKALLLCISYLFYRGSSDAGNRPTPLEGPLNDAKEMKTALIGGLNVDSTTAFSPLSRSTS